MNEDEIRERGRGKQFLATLAPPRPSERGYFGLLVIWSTCAGSLLVGVVSIAVILARGAQ